MLERQKRSQDTKSEHPDNIPVTVQAWTDLFFLITMIRAEYSRKRRGRNIKCYVFHNKNIQCFFFFLDSTNSRWRWRLPFLPAGENIHFWPILVKHSRTVRWYLKTVPDWRRAGTSAMARMNVSPLKVQQLTTHIPPMRRRRSDSFLWNGIIEQAWYYS